MKRFSARRIAFLCTAAVAAAALLIAAGVLAWQQVRTSEYHRQIELGDKYYGEGNYAAALLAYQAALDISDEEEEAYVGLVRVYTAQGNTAMANALLERGMHKTPGRLLSLLKIDLDAAGRTAQDGGGEAAGGTDGKADAVPVLDSRLLERFASTDFDGYRLKEGIESSAVQGGSCDVRAAGIAATLHFFPTSENHNVVDPNTDRPYSRLIPNAVTLDDISRLFGGAQTVTYEELESMRLAGLARETDAEHGDVVSFTAFGCRVRIACGADGSVSAGAWNEIVPTGENAGSAASLTGRILDATTAGGVAHAEMQFASSSGEVVAETESDGYGSFTVDLNGGDYLVTVSCPGYITETFECYVSEYQSVTERSFTISPALAEGEVRIVLEWGSYPADLDSRLRGEMDGGEIVTVSYREKQAYAGGELAAELDVDDIDGYGPETTTIYDLNGVYEFVVVDFRATGGLSQSGAVVKVYMPGQDAPTVIEVCSGLEYGWHVFRLDHGELEVTNRAAATSPGAVK